MSFDRAAEVLLDPLAVSVLDEEHRDEEHSEGEERWVTLGRDKHGRVVILIHTFVEVSTEECRVRIISARKATKREIKQYEEMQL